MKQERKMLFLGRKHETDWRLFAIISCSLFVIFGFVDVMPGTSISSLWFLVAVLVSRSYINAGGLLFVIGIYALVLGLFAMLFSWVAQGLIVVFCHSFCSRKNNGEASVYLMSVDELAQKTLKPSTSSKIIGVKSSFHNL